MMISLETMSLRGCLRLRYRRILLLRAARRLFCTVSGEREEDQHPKGKEISVAASSLRIDTVVAAGLDISRKYVLVA